MGFGVYRPIRRGWNTPSAPCTPVQESRDWHSGIGDWDLGRRDWGWRFGVSGFGFRIPGSGLQFLVFGLRFSGFEFRARFLLGVGLARPLLLLVDEGVLLGVDAVVLRAPGSGFGCRDLGFRFQDFGIRVSGYGCEVYLFFFVDEGVVLGVDAVVVRLRVEHRAGVRHHERLLLALQLHREGKKNSI